MDKANNKESAGSKYLRDFTGRMADMPGYLKRHLALIRDLDEKVQGLQKEIDLHSKRKLAARQPESAANKRQKAAEAAAYDVDSAVTKLLSLADEKVTIASQVYDFVDSHIKYLDETLGTLEAEIQAERAAAAAATAAGADKQKGRARAKSTDEPGPSNKGSGLIKSSKKGGAAAAGGGGGTGGGKAGSSKAGAAAAPAADMTLSYIGSPNANEPLYCYCQRPSHGTMVGCDNEDCPYEWFHLECVGLTEIPGQNEKWYCPDCRKIMGKGGRQDSSTRS